MVSVLPGQVLGQEGFQLSVSLVQAHLPRMWVEKHPDKMSQVRPPHRPLTPPPPPPKMLILSFPLSFQACMLVFYPEFNMGPQSACEEVVILLDTSESMKGEALKQAQRVAMQVLHTLDTNIRVNIILFGTG